MLHPFTRHLDQARELIAHAGRGVLVNTLADLADLAREHDLEHAEAWLVGLFDEAVTPNGYPAELVVAAFERVLEAAGPYRHPRAVDLAVTFGVGEVPRDRRREFARALAGFRRDELILLNVVRTEVDGIRRWPEEQLRRDQLLADLDVMAVA